MNNDLDFNGASRTINVQNSYAIISGTVNNSGAQPASLVKLGAGTLLVLGNNYTYDGPTIISAGTVQLGDYYYHTGTLPGINGNAGNVTNSATLTFANLGDQTLSGNVVGGGGLQINSHGTLTLTGTNAYSGNTTLTRGALKLDFSAANAPGTNIIGTGAGSGLILSSANFEGGTLQVLGKDGVTNRQAFKSLTINQGTNSIVAQSGNSGGSLTLVLSNITRSAGSLLDITLPVAGQVLAGNTNINGILSGAITIGGTDWASSNSAVGNLAVVSNYTGYVTVGSGSILDGGTQNIRLNGNAGLAAATTTINTLAITNDGGSYTLSLAGQTLRMGTVGGLLVPSGAGVTTIGSAPSDGFLTAGSLANTTGELVLINNSANPLTINANIASNGSAAITLTKAGSGTVNFAGNINNRGTTYFLGGTVNLGGTNYLGPVNISAGTLNFLASSSNDLGGTLVINDATVNINGVLNAQTSEIQMGTIAGSRSVLNIFTNVTANRIRPVANADGVFAAGAIFQTGGTVTTYASDAGLTVADSTLNSGYYSLSTGTYTGDVRVSYRGYGIMDVRNGGVVQTSNTLQLVNASGVGIMNVYSGGLIVAPGNSGGYISGSGSAYYGGLGVLNVLGGAVNAANGSLTKPLEMGNAAGNTMYVNLIGGSITANHINVKNSDGVSVFNFNGGTLVAANSTNNFMINLSGAYVYSGGATIDSMGNNIAIKQNLLAPSAYGLSSIPLNGSRGSQYLSPPVVQITGGSGTGALAIAEVDFSTGSITNFWVVNPGYGYQASDVLTITLQGGAPLSASTPFTISGASLAANVSGSLTKLGSGTLALCGSNSYGGGTLLNVGTPDRQQQLCARHRCLEHERRLALQHRWHLATNQRCELGRG